MKGCWQKGHALSLLAGALFGVAEESAFEPGEPACSAISNATVPLFRLLRHEKKWRNVAKGYGYNDGGGLLILPLRSVQCEYTKECPATVMRGERYQREAGTLGHDALSTGLQCDPTNLNLDARAPNLELILNSSPGSIEAAGWGPVPKSATPLPKIKLTADPCRRFLTQDEVDG